MAERIFIGVAWPYANYILHLGHQVLEVAADVFARYHRLKGSEVLMVSGSDCHGTPITVAAETEGKTPAEVASYYHARIVEHFEQLGLSYDLYTHTMTDNHTETTQEIFSALLDRGYIYKDTMEMLHCSSCDRYLPDRYVLGTCPHCGFEDARGDQCDDCGRQLNPTDLKAPRCGTCDAPPQPRRTEHFFIDLKKLAPKIAEWFEPRAEHMRPNVVRFTRNLLENIRERAITRDIDWGVPVPVAGFESKRIYVWFDAVIGYLSASREWAAKTGDPDAWKKWWTDDACRAYYFLGKDNIPFHTIIWPGMLIGVGGYTLPEDVPANEYLTMEGKQFSKSRGVVIKIDHFLENYQADALRFFITLNGPETSDSSFTWKSFQQRINDELVGKWGNLVHRALHFAFNKLDGVVPAACEPDAAGAELLGKIDGVIVRAGEQVAACRFKEALLTIMEAVGEGNVYFDKKAPWKQIKEDRSACEQTIYTILQAINGLKTLTAPFCPFGAGRLHGYLGYDDDLHAQTDAWSRAPLPGGQRLRQPEPLFRKVEDEQIEKEIAALEENSKS